MQPFPFDPIGTFATWFRGDALPELAPIDGLRIELAEADDLERLSTALPMPASDAAAWMRAGNRLYVARVGDAPASFGWSAAAVASIPELGIEVPVLSGDRYLWGFETLPDWRGMGLYPKLLQAIVQQEDADRFWIGYDRGNDASARGIVSAGFSPVGVVYRHTDGGLRHVPLPGASSERAEAGSALFLIPIEQQYLSADE